MNLRLTIAVCLLALLPMKMFAQDVESCRELGSDFDATAPVSDDQTVDDDFVLSKVEVETEIFHNSIVDLSIVITSPAGTELTLYDGGADDGDADIHVTWSDDGVDHGTDDFDCDCSMQPVGVGGFAEFNGETSDGTWTLDVVDGGTDAGTFMGWCLLLTECPVTAPSSLTCVADGTTVELTWTNEGAYDILNVFRDGELLEAVDTESESYSDEDVSTGNHVYSLFAFSADDDCGRDSESCSVDVGVVCDDRGYSIGFDFDPVVSEIEVDDDPDADDVRVSIDLTHAVIGDLDIDVTAPDGTNVTLHDELGGDDDDILLTYSDDGIGNGLDDYDCDCDMEPSGPGVMADLLTGASDGTWTLLIVDNGEVANGELNVWCLEFVGGGTGGGDDPVFLRGDANGNGAVLAIIDALFLLQYGFVAFSPAPPCLEAADIDGDGSVFPILDALYVLEFGFNSGPEPPAPFPDCEEFESIIGCEEECP